MSDTLHLSAETRDRVGKGASRALRRDGRVPAVIYGNKEEPQGIHLNARELMKQLMTGHFMNSVIMVDVGGKKVRTLAKDVAFDVVSDQPIHVDFLRISKNATVTVAVPVTFVNEDEAPGIKRAGGVLNVVRHEIELVVEASNIPTEIVVDLTGREVGDSIHISEVSLPNGAEPAVEDRDFTVATIVPPTVPTAADEALDAEVAEAQSAEAAAEAEAEAAADEEDKAEG
ncbi:MULTISPECIES: 50S ribosomal protein L25/general stress protein Ctc [unclassified Sphingomonas]|uniref:50S ribosomal protein L25/general stress protein Ctc n=1 Tax=unclassified Sphingomonas TaxID=196159 RepID=UPI0006F8B485|nr:MULTISPECIES: 50S ribosomal protein L25/general stress protein Ctc [unclassified Sphingomonas]KQN00386.1 50S ribosomal protein L25 [Sphingomonas sp. Leaf25]KQN36506.1 50S ribosomal protein L25 [Sphingomonas sp. Leaf42]KQT27127.1 50S ribosomal protein L25 [Sphingomonas sp. Leaf407]